MFWAATQVTVAATVKEKKVVYLILMVDDANLCLAPSPEMDIKLKSGLKPAAYTDLYHQIYERT